MLGTKFRCWWYLFNVGDWRKYKKIVDDDYQNGQNRHQDLLVVANTFRLKNRHQHRCHGRLLKLNNLFHMPFSNSALEITSLCFVTRLLTAEYVENRFYFIINHFLVDQILIVYCTIDTYSENLKHLAFQRANVYILYILYIFIIIYLYILYLNALSH